MKIMRRVFGLTLAGVFYGAIAATVMGVAAESQAAGGRAFEVRFDEGARAAPATGRLVVYLIAPGAKLPRVTSPGDGPFFQDPQPMYGIDVRDWTPGTVATVDDAATGFPVELSKLPPGDYRAQAVLDMSRADSSWQREPGNLYSTVVPVTISPAGLRGTDGQPVTLTLSKVVEKRKASRVNGAAGNDDFVGAGGAEIFEVKSELLSKFRGKDVMLRAGVVYPMGFDPTHSTKKYPAIYSIPGFGDDEAGALSLAQRRRDGMRPGPRADLAQAAFDIVLGPESPNGHTLFADSDNNGPVGEALVKELIPALEKKYPLIAEASARLVTGHSSGGWSSLWVQLNYPDTFGGCWSSSPDPVDFRRFQLVDIYRDSNFYRKDGKDEDTPSYRSQGESKMTIRQENRMEEVIAPCNGSGQQWDSWAAVFGPRNEDGKPAMLYDPQTGEIDHKIAEKYRRYDVAELLRHNPATYGPIFREKVRLIVGGEDSFYLNEAVELLQETLKEVSPQVTLEVLPGYIKIVPGTDHGSVMGSNEARAFPAEMLEALRKAGHIPPEANVAPAGADGAGSKHP
ncbi:MAG TPA: alpha/beta hydrolase-fold protein [Phycisphaerales bacterium]|nr:alpha/beta hydrolase-fold protein [Phycisphaerales bacterium]